MLEEKNIFNQNNISCFTQLIDEEKEIRNLFKKEFAGKCLLCT